MVLSKEEIDLIDATPSKRIYRSIIADYGLNTAICELIDNAIDVKSLQSGGPNLVIAVDIDLDQQRIILKDNAGGVKESELKKLISPGESTMSGLDESIGIFGVGSKRAVVALSQLVRITTRYHKEQTFRLEYDDDWLSNSDWSLPYHKIPPIQASTTEVDLSNLRFRIEEDDIKRLRGHLSETYAYFLDDGKIAIELNGTPIVGRFFDTWAYPPEFEPSRFIKRLTPKNSEGKIKFDITAGLTVEGGSIAGDYGVFFYCNRRLISKALKTPEVGFLSGVAGIPHPKMSLTRIIVRLEGPSESMPWTSNKANLNYNHPVFQAIKGDVIQAVKTYTGLSKRLHPDFKEKVQPFPDGEIETQKLKKDEPIKPNRLPVIPKTRVDYKATILELNRKLGFDKPWVRGLYEGIVAELIITRQRSLEQRNRISLIILDSILEIAFKDYLANEIPHPLGDDKLRNLFKDRLAVHREIEKHILKGSNIWKKINYFYKLRCDLIHRKANVSISDANIDVFRKTVIRVLKKTFRVKFPGEYLE